MTDPLQIRDATPGDIETLRELANRTWRVCYPGIISNEQIEYMLGWMYSAEKILAEMQSESIRYLLAKTRGETGIAPSGFASFGPADNDDTIFLHKLYVLPECQRQGIGAALLSEIEKNARGSGKTSIQLRVNRANSIAIAAYEKAGFVTTETDCSDIGNGFVMDDFIMTRRLDPPVR